MTKMSGQQLVLSFVCHSQQVIQTKQQNSSFPPPINVRLWILQFGSDTVATHKDRNVVNCR